MSETASPLPAIVVSQPVGTLPGELSVDANGAAQYSVPINVPAGRAGMQPALALSYNSRSGNGLLGVGWSLSGLSSITRCPQSLAQDGTTRGVEFNADDKLCLDGQKLVLVGGSYNAAGSEYRTEAEPFTRIRLLSADLLGPTEFEVRQRGGRILRFGVAGNARVDAPRVRVDDQGQRLTSALSGRYAWLLSRVEDRSGNYMTVTYGKEQTPGVGLGPAAIEWWPSRIDYAGNGDSAPRRSVRFVHSNTREDTRERFVGGLHMRTSRRLDRIETWVQRAGADSLVSSYRLRYLPGTASRPARLAGLRACDYAGSCMPETQFEWSTLDAGYDEVPTGINDVGGSTVQITADHHLMDVDGDGDSDLVYRVDEGIPARPVWYLRKWVGTGFSARTRAGLRQAIPLIDTLYETTLPVDYDNDGRMDIYAWVNVFDINTAFFLYRSTGDGFELVPNGSSPGGGASRFSSPFLVDADGDNRLEVWSTRPVNWNLVGNTPSSWWTRRFEGNQWGDWTNTGFLVQADITQALTADWNGSGRSSLIMPTSRPLPGFRASRAVRLGDDGTPEAQLVNAPKNVIGLVVGADVNGDGLRDFVDTLLGEVSVSTGNGFQLPSRIPGYFPSRLCVGAGCDSGVRVLDSNLDGRDDVLVTSADPRAPDTLWESSSAGLVSVPMPLSIPPPLGDYRQFLQLADVDGDGLTDITQVSRDGLFRLFLRRGELPDRLIRVTNGLGRKSEVTYSSTVDPAVHGRLTQGAYPFRNVQGGLQVVSELRLDDGAGGFERFKHSYFGGVVHQRGRGFLGFRSHTVVDVRTGATTTTEYNITEGQDTTRERFPLAGMPARQTSVVRAGGRYLATTTEYQYRVRERDGGRTYFVRPQRTVVRRHDQERIPATGWTAQTAYSTLITTSGFDDFGNLISSSVDSTDGFVDNAAMRVRNDEQRWLLGLVERRTETSQSPGAVEARATAYTYETNTGLISTITVEPNRPELRLVTTYTRNPVDGLVERMATVDRFANERAVSITYEPTERVFPESVSNHLGHTQRLLFEPGLGVVTRATDANGQIAYAQYDGFGRRRALRAPDGATMKMDYEASTTAPLVVTSTDPSGDVGITEMDRRGLATRVYQHAYREGWLQSETDYDTRGRPTKQWHTHRLGEPRTTFTQTDYDDADRPIRITTPEGVTTVAYRALDVTVTNPRGYSTFTGSDARGRTRVSCDQARRCNTFDFGPFSTIRYVRDAFGHTTEARFDRRGRRTYLDDPDAGITTWAFNAWGETTRQVNANQEAVDFEYDSLGRLAFRTDADGVSSWTYDTAPHGIGLPATDRSADGVLKEYGYDDLSRLDKSTTTVDGEDFVVSVAYDEIGRIAGVDYPSVPGQPTRFNVRHSYDPWSGHLARVSDGRPGGADIWEAEAEDIFGNVTDALFGNGVARTVTDYDPATGRLRSIETSAAEGVVQQLGYTWDPNGNLQTRQDGLLAKTETFTYDPQDRMASSTVTGESRIDYPYDDLGNLLARAGGTLEYNERDSGPHQLSTYFGLPVTHDKAGRQTVVAGYRAVTYTTFDLPRRIELAYGKQRLSEFTYDAQQARTTKTVGSRVTTYIGGLYEREVDGIRVKHRFHVMGVAEVELADGVETIHYVHGDHIGSPSVVTDGTGQVVERRSYDPWGQRRNEDWTTSAAQLSSRVNIGYTGHEDDEETGLVNMAGRIYDPISTRFLTADPIVQAPGATLGLNRYAYVFDNPLSFTDPSGFCVATDQADCPEIVTFDEPDVVTAERPAPEQPAGGQGDTNAPDSPTPDAGESTPQGTRAPAVPQATDTERAPVNRPLGPQPSAEQQFKNALDEHAFNLATLGANRLVQQYNAGGVPAVLQWELQVGQSLTDPAGSMAASAPGTAQALADATADGVSPGEWGHVAGTVLEAVGFGWLMHSAMGGAGITPAANPSASASVATENQAARVLSTVENSDVILHHGSDVASVENIVASGRIDQAAARVVGGGDIFWAHPDVAIARWFARSNPSGGSPAVLGIRLPAGALERMQQSGVLAIERGTGAIMVRNWSAFNSAAQYFRVE